MGAQRLVLEGRGHREDLMDRRAIRDVLGPRPSSAGLVYEHLRSHEEPLLWVPDAVAWCHGADGEWRRRVVQIIDAVIDVGRL